MWQIGPYTVHSRVVLAPMAGVTDLPMRQLARQMGAGLAASEMLTSDESLWDSRKSSMRLAGLTEDAEPRQVQIAGADPEQLASAARGCVARGAQIIDINMGCPAKKVCKQAAGSALLKDEPLVARILQAVVQAVEVPVTLKFRTGWDLDNNNALTIGKMAEDCGIKALTLHGRSRACGYHAPAEYDTIAALAQAVSIPVVANGDIQSPEQAKRVLDYTGAQAVMIGRASHGQPWLLRDIAGYLNTGSLPTALPLAAKQRMIVEHISAIHRFYGARQGVKMARKHAAWYGQHLGWNATWRQSFNTLSEPSQQLSALADLWALPNELVA